MKEYRFKGGPIALNSGGMGPDDYLLKPIRGGCWTLVVFKYGRNSGQSQITHVALEEMDSAKSIHKLNKQICVSDMARRYQRMRECGTVLTMSGCEFLAKYGNSPLVKFRDWE